MPWHTFVCRPRTPPVLPTGSSLLAARGRCADLQGRGLPEDDSREAEHLLLRHVLALDRGEEAPPSGGGGGSRLCQPAAEEGGVPLVPERRGHVHLLRPGGDPCFLEHDGKAPLLG